MKTDLLELDNNMASYRKALEDEFFKEFPELKGFLDMSFFGSSITQMVTSGGGSLSSQNEKYNGSEYFYSNSDNLNKEFVHFTSVKSLLSILQTNSLRFSTLNGMNDPNEIAFASEIFGLTDEQIEHQKKSVLSFSLCEFLSDDDEIITNANNLDLWRFYGQDGNGVAIKFKIHNEFEKWNSYHFAKIKYGKKLLDYWRKVKNSLDKFNSKYPEFGMNLAQLLSFHKTKYYKNEQEVRLIFAAYFNKTNNELEYSKAGGMVDSVNVMYPNVEKKNDGFVSYLPLYSAKLTHAQEYYLEQSPKISIEAIILGYRFMEHELPVYRDIINDLLSKSTGYTLTDDKITISELSKHYR